MSRSLNCPSCGRTFPVSESVAGDVPCQACGAVLMSSADGSPGTRGEMAVLLRPSELKPGDFLAQYRIEEKLGQGGMGAVYRAVSESGETVAIKVLSGKSNSDIVYIRRFLREARLAAAIRHENAVEVLSVTESPDGRFYYIVQEYVAGGSVRQWLQVNGLMEEQQAARVALGAARALCEAARIRVVHRDIKPDNILLTEEGVPKLADLGLATQARDPEEIRQMRDEDVAALYQNNSGRSLTLSWIALGTPAYMAPEQVGGSKKADGRADIYGLGATLYHMLAGHPPFEAKSVREMFRKLTHDTAPDIRTQRRGVSSHMARVIERCLKKDPADRFQTPEDLASELYLLAGIEEPGVNDTRIEPLGQVPPVDRSSPSAQMYTSPVPQARASSRRPVHPSGFEELTQPLRFGRETLIIAACILLGALAVMLLIRISGSQGAGADGGSTPRAPAAAEENRGL